MGGVFPRRGEEYGLLFLRPELPVHDEEHAPPCREEDGVGDPAHTDVEGAGEASEVGAEEKDGIAARVTAKEGPRGGGVGCDGETHARRSPSGEEGGERLERSPLFETRAAPGGPEIDEKGLPVREGGRGGEREEGIAREGDAPVPFRTVDPGRAEDVHLGPAGGVKDEKTQDAGRETGGEPAGYEEDATDPHGVSPPPSVPAPRTSSAQAAYGREASSGGSVRISGTA